LPSDELPEGLAGAPATISVPQPIAFNQPGTLFLTARGVARKAFPQGTPRWIKRVGRIVLAVDRALRRP
jgi:hypothetical protein